MRLFTALDLPPDTLLSVERLLSELRPEADISWTPAENLHITTKFIGEWPEARLDEVDATLEPLRFCAPFHISLRGLGWFPDADVPKSLWAGVHSDALPDFAARKEESLAALGIGKDPHPFSPHLTLARVRNVPPLQALRSKVAALDGAPISHFCAANFFLYRSETGGNASIYRKIRTYSFEPKP